MPEPTQTPEVLDRIDAFVAVAQSLSMSERDECSLLGVRLREWRHWRAHTVAADAMPPAHMERRLAYALPLLRRMAAAALNTG
jgi:hypothetical protein